MRGGERRAGLGGAGSGGRPMHGAAPHAAGPGRARPSPYLPEAQRLALLLRVLLRLSADPSVLPLGGAPAAHRRPRPPGPLHRGQQLPGAERHRRSRSSARLGSGPRRPHLPAAARRLPALGPPRTVPLPPGRAPAPAPHRPAPPRAPRRRRPGERPGAGSPDGGGEGEGGGSRGRGGGRRGRGGVAGAGGGRLPRSGRRGHRAPRTAPPIRWRPRSAHRGRAHRAEPGTPGTAPPWPQGAPTLAPTSPRPARGCTCPQPTRAVPANDPQPPGAAPWGRGLGAASLPGARRGRPGPKRSRSLPGVGCGELEPGTEEKETPAPAVFQGNADFAGPG